MLGYSGHVSALTFWWTSWDTAVGSFFVIEVTHYSPSGYVLIGQDHLLWLWTCTTFHALSCHSKWHVEWLPFCTSHFVLFTFLFPLQHQLCRLSQLQKDLVLLQFPLPDVVITKDFYTQSLGFSFQHSGFHVSCSGTWSTFICKVHFALQDLQAVALMLHRMAFQVSGKVVAIHLNNNNTTKAHFCNYGGTASPFLSRLAWLHFESGWKAWYYIYSA